MLFFWNSTVILFFIGEVMKKICFLVDSWFFGEHSGIYTFIKHYATLISKLEGYKLDIITDHVVERKYLEDSVFSEVGFFTGPSFENQIYGEIEDSIVSYCEKLNDYVKDNEPILIVSHSFMATKAMCGVTTNAKKMVYTHIGDILDGKKSTIYDFSEEYVKEHLLILSNDNSILIGTQNNSLVDVLERIVGDKERIKHLPEPFYHPKPYRSNPSGPVIIISSNYKRKNLEDMVRIVSKNKMGLMLIAGEWEEESCKPIEYIIKDNCEGLESSVVYRQIPNKRIHRFISKCSAMLHMSSIEVMPYAILEAMLHVPVIINSDSIWGKCFPFSSVYRFSLSDDIDIKDIIANHDIDKAINEVGEYSRLSEEYWFNFLGGL